MFVPALHCHAPSEDDGSDLARKKLIIAIILAFFFMVIEIIGRNSLILVRCKLHPGRKLLHSTHSPWELSNLLTYELL